VQQEGVEVSDLSEGHHPRCPSLRLLIPSPSFPPYPGNSR
jgi:hypothetical protein